MSETVGFRYSHPKGSSSDNGESGEGEFEAPRGITTVAVHLPERDVEIVVTDHYSGRIQMFTPQGKFLRQWKEENWDYPRPEETTSLPGGEIAIVDSRNCCVQVFGFALV